MIQNLLNSLFKSILTLMVLGLAVAIFLIGIVALWYFLLIGMGIWLVRSLYLAFRARQNGPVQAGGVEVIQHEEWPSKRKSDRPGRVIDHE